MGQGAVEKAGNHRPDRVGFVQHDRPVLSPQPADFGGEGLVIGGKPSPPAFGDLVLGRLLAAPVERLAVEGGGRAKLSGRLAGIEGGAAGVAIDVDYGARHRRAHQGRSHFAGEVIEPVDPPVGILARQPRRDQALFDLRRDLGSRVRETDDQRGRAALDGEPGGIGAHHAPASKGKGTVLAAAITRPSRTWAVAASMSGCMWRSWSRKATSARRPARTASRAGLDAMP